jgi:hypothetical protein
MPPNTPTGAPDSNHGNNATITVSREDLMAKTATQLKIFACGQRFGCASDFLTFGIDDVNNTFSCGRD